LTNVVRISNVNNCWTESLSADIFNDYFRCLRLRDFQTLLPETTGLLVALVGDRHRDVWRWDFDRVNQHATGVARGAVQSLVHHWRIPGRRSITDGHSLPIVGQTLRHHTRVPAV